MQDARRMLVAGNWKMNGLRADGAALAREVAHRAIAATRDGAPGLACELLVCPPATLLTTVGEALAGSPVQLGGQDCHVKPAGAHTGDIAAPMLKDCGCSHVILGHSERRADHRETDAEVRGKAEAARAAGLVAIVCVGETESERDAGRAFDIVSGQLAGSLPKGMRPEELVIAYEPVWAIGTGRTPTVDDIAAMHAHIRRGLAGAGFDGSRIRILYGGSVKPSNAKEILGLAEVDGALVGGASLKPGDFWEIAAACS